jgi:hypothetical protein
MPKRRAFSTQRIALACLGVLGTGGLLVLAGCPANLENPERFDMPNTNAGASATGGGAPGGGAGSMVDLSKVTPLFAMSCATSVACHAGAAVSGLDLTPPFEARLVNAPATHLNSGVTDCPAAKLIDTATPAKSWLLLKVTPGAFGDCGALMPFAAPMPLGAADMATITKFVNDEAAAATGMAPAAAGGAATGTGGAAAGTGGAATAGSGGM